MLKSIAVCAMAYLFSFALIENGSWVPAAAKKMSDMLSSLKDVKILDNKVTIKIAVTQEVVVQLESLAEELLKELPD